MATPKKQKGRPTQQNADSPFRVCFGEFTEDEKQHLLEIGHIWKNSQGEIFDVSTKTESDFEGLLECSGEINENGLEEIELENNVGTVDNSSFTNETKVQFIDIVDENDPPIQETSNLISTNVEFIEIEDALDVTKDFGNTPNTFISQREIFDLTTDSVVQVETCVEPNSIHPFDFFDMNASLSVTNSTPLRKILQPIDRVFATPMTPVSAQKSVRRSLRIVMQKNSIQKLPQFNISTTSESGLGLSTLYNEEQPSQRSESIEIEDTSDISKDFGNTLNTFETSVKARTSGFGLQRIFETPKRNSIAHNSRKSKSLAQISPNPEACGIGNVSDVIKDVTPKTPQKNSLVHNSRKSVAGISSKGEASGIEDASDVTRDMFLNTLEHDSRKSMARDISSSLINFDNSLVTKEVENAGLETDVEIKIIDTLTEDKNEIQTDFIEIGNLTNSSVNERAENQNNLEMGKLMEDSLGEIFDSTNDSAVQVKTCVEAKSFHLFDLSDMNASLPVTNSTPLRKNLQPIDRVFATPITPVSAQKSVRRSLRIALQKRSIQKLSQFNISTTSESGLGLSTLYNEEQPSQRSESIEIEDTSDISKDFGNTPNTFETSVKARTSGFGLQRIFETPKRNSIAHNSRKSKSLAQISPNPEACGIENVSDVTEDFTPKTPQRNSLAHNSRKSVAGISSKGEASGIQDVLNTTVPLSTLETSMKVRTSEFGIKRLFETPKRNSKASNSPKAKSLARISHTEACVIKNVPDLTQDATPKTPQRHSLTQNPRKSVAPISLNIEANGIKDVTPKTPQRHSLTQNPRKSVAPISLNIEANGIKDVSDATPKTPQRHSLAQNSRKSVAPISLNIEANGIKDVTPKTPQRHSLAQNPRKSVGIYLNTAANGINNVTPKTPQRHSLAQNPRKSVGISLNTVANGIEDISDVTKDLSLSTLETSFKIQTQTSSYTPKSSTANVSRKSMVRDISDSESPCLINFENSILTKDVENGALETDFEVKTLDVITEDENEVQTDLIKIGNLTYSFEKERDISISMFESSKPTSNENDSQEDLDDTIDIMNKLLALADEQEANEHLENSKNFTPNVKANIAQKETPNNLEQSSLIKFQTPSSDAKEMRITPSPVVSAVNKIMERQRSRNLFSPSPPRSTVILQSHSKINLSQEKPQLVPFKTPIPPPTKPLFFGSPIYMSSTPKRKSLCGIKSKVDSGLRCSPGFSLGLMSPVADYIYSKPTPSKFAKVNNPTKMVYSGQSGNMISRLPLPQLNSTKASPATPADKQTRMLYSASKQNSFQGRPSIDPCTPNADKFKTLKYTAPAKLKTPGDASFNLQNYKENYLALRHTGNRDESGNASIIQNMSVPKPFIQSRLLPPKSYVKPK